MGYLKQSPEKATYVSGNAAGAGQYKINRRDGKLEFSKTLFALEGERLPMALRLAYVQDLPASITTLVGGKWKFNYEQYLYAEDGGYVYIDGQGKRHEFVKFSGSTNEYMTPVSAALSCAFPQARRPLRTTAPSPSPLRAAS